MAQEGTPRRWFPEPEQEDATWGTPVEAIMSWLARSTVPRAVAVRDFLDRNVSALPEDFQPIMVRNLRGTFRHRSALFELIVCRTLQLLGASIEVEPAKNPKDRKIDFVAWFYDGVAAIEATSPVFDAEAGVTLRDRAPLVETISASAPDGWAVRVLDLPALGPNDTKKRFKAEVADMLNVPPPKAGEGPRQLERELPEGDIVLELWPKGSFGAPDAAAIVSEPPFTVIDKTEAVVRRALKRKREQARTADVPAVVAIDAKGLTSSLEAFDEALFGRMRQHDYGLGSLSEPWFVPDGVFARGSGAPTIAGVLAYVDLGMLSARDPVLYVHPRFDGRFPEALMRLERRTFDPEGNGIATVPSCSAGLLRALGFPPEGI